MTEQIEPGVKLRQVISDVADIARNLWEKGWAERNAGNVSVNVTELIPGETTRSDQFSFQEFQSVHPELVGCCLMITGAGTRMRRLAERPGDVLRVIRFAEGKPGFQLLWGAGGGGPFRPTSEFSSHLHIHRFLVGEGRPQKVVLHTHPTELIALTHIKELIDESLLNGILWSMHPEVKIVLPDGAGLVRYRLPGSDDLALETVETLRSHHVAIWEKHGVLAVGVDADEAFDRIDTLNKAALIFLACKTAGYDPEGLSEKQIQDLINSFMKSSLQDHRYE